MAEPTSAYELIGQVTVAWNRIEWFLHDLFRVFLDAPKEQADAIYLSLASPAAQRDIVRSLAQVRLADKPKKLQLVLNAETAVGKASGKRNVTIHSRYLRGKGSPNLYVNESYRFMPTENDLSGKNVVLELRETLEELKTVENSVWLALAATAKALGRKMS